MKGAAKVVTMGKHKKNHKKQPDSTTRLNKNSSWKKNKLKSLSLGERMKEKLKSSRFRYINEEIYTMRGSDALTYFKQDPAAFQAYHLGYQQQLEQWSVDPLDIVIKSLKKQCKAGQEIADFGCGTARLAKALPSFTVHSFDLVSLDPLTTVCDMASTPLPSASVDFVVCCLSLMGTNFSDYIKEANRVLKIGGTLKIAEVESRFEDVERFLLLLGKYGFKVSSRDLEHRLFYFFDLKKETNIGKRSKKSLPELILKPCIYKKR